MRRAIILLVLVLVGAACNNADGSDPTLAPGPTSTTTDGSTTEAPVTSSAATVTTTEVPDSTTTAVPQPTVPLPNPEEDDFTTIWLELMDYHNWAFANPELADPTDYLAESCDCLERAKAILAEYLANGWSAVGDGIIVHSTEVEVESSTFALMTVIDEQAELTILGPEGQVVEVIERRPKTFFDVRVRKTEDGWRIAEWNQRGAEGAAE